MDNPTIAMAVLGSGRRRGAYVPREGWLAGLARILGLAKYRARTRA